MPVNHNNSDSNRFPPTPNGDIEMNRLVEHNSYPAPGGTPAGIPGATPTGASPAGGSTCTGKPRELRVYYSGDLKRRTKLEKYLMLLCAVLFVAAVVFLIIALTRESRSRGEWFCFLHQRELGVLTVQFVKGTESQVGVILTKRPEEQRHRGMWSCLKLSEMVW